MDKQFNHAAVGLFVLLLSAAAIVAIIWLSAGRPHEEYLPYEVYIQESVAGLNKGAPVKYRGVDVGRVKSIELDPHNLELVRVLLDIQKGTIIKEDATATMETQGLLGIYYINLTGGSAAAPPLTAKAGQDYPVIPNRPSIFGRVEDVVSKLSTSIEGTMASINRLLSDDNVRSLSSTLGDVSSLTREVAKHSGDIDTGLENVRVILGNFRQTSEGLVPLIQQMQRSVGAVEQMTSDLSKIVTVINDKVRTTGEDVQHFTGQSLPEVSATIVELRQTSENLRNITEQLSRDPAAVLFGTHKQAPGPGE